MSTRAPSKINALICLFIFFAVSCGSGSDLENKGETIQKVDEVNGSEENISNYEEKREQNTFSLLNVVLLIVIISLLVVLNKNKQKYRSKKINEKKSNSQPDSVVTDKSKISRLKSEKEQLELQSKKDSNKIQSLQKTEKILANIQNELNGAFNPTLNALIKKLISVDPIKIPYSKLFHLKLLISYYLKHNKKDWFFKRDEESLIFHIGLHLYDTLEALGINNDQLWTCVMSINEQLKNYNKYIKIIAFKPPVAYDPEMHYSLSGQKRQHDTVIVKGFAISNKDDDTVIKKAPVQ